MAAAEARSFDRAAIVMKQVGGQGVSAKTIERMVHDSVPNWPSVATLTPRRMTPLQYVLRAPRIGRCRMRRGRIRTREPGHGPGVHCTTEGWRETKNAVLIRASRTVSIDDPQPEPPACFCNSKHVAKIAETEAFSVASSLPGLAPDQQREVSPELPTWLKPTIGVPSGWSALCWPASPSQRFSASKWSVRPSEGDSSRQTPRRSWGMGCPGTGRSGRSTSRLHADPGFHPRAELPVPDRQGGS